MEEKTYKENLHKKFKHILELLTKKSISFGFDKEISENEIMFFNEYMTQEGFEDDISETLLPELIESLKDYEFYEPDKDKLIALKNHMADRVLNPALDPFDELVFEGKLKHLNKEHTDTVESFIRIQEKLRSTIAENISANLSNTKKYLRLVWNGNQTQLAELFQVLINRGWIDAPQNKKAFVNTLCEMFFARNDDTMNKNITDYYYRDKYTANGIFSNITPAPKEK